MTPIVNPYATRGLPTGGSLTLRLRFVKVIRRTWRRVREWCGDAAYESYLRAKHRNAAVGRPLTAKEFYVEQLERRYSRPNRCC
jgi:uncharacterized short protein YbdD (DUF466 family)